MNLDIILANVPGTITDMPLLAPALLKAVLIQHGYTCKTIDFNARFYHDVKNYKDLEVYFVSGDENDKTVKSQALKLIDGWIDELLALSPTYISFSVFTIQSRVATSLFCQQLRKRAPWIRIIIGGQGIAGGINGSVEYADNLIEQKLIDYYIRSEGEQALIELLRGNITYPGINSPSFEQLKDLDAIPMPDYSDYDFSLYPQAKLMVLNSRGCIRKCTFCDIHEHWKTFRWRNGFNVAKEIIALSEKYNINEFVFGDSLVNGNLKSFVEFLDAMSDYNNTAKNKILWQGQYIVRSKKQIPQGYWKKLADSGARQLGLGIETGSDQVRSHMNKRFTNEDLDYTMDMLAQYNITCTFLMIIGYPTETEDDFNDTLRMFGRYKHLAGSIITDIELGTTLSIFPGTPLYHNAAHWNIELDKYETNWIANDNQTLTFKERIRRRIQAEEYAKSLGYQMSTDRHAAILKNMEEQYTIFEKRNKLKKLIKIKHDRV